jgi:hypothetical protein
VDWWKVTNVSNVPAASIIKAVGLQGATIEMTAIFTLAAVRTSNVTTLFNLLIQ